MSNVNFSDLQSVSSIDGGAQISIRLNNALSGADGFAKITKGGFEKSLGVFTTVQANSAAWNVTDVNGMKDFAFINYYSGDNSTAVMGDPSKPYKSLSAAYTAAKNYIQNYKAKLFLQTNFPEILTIGDDNMEITIYGGQANNDYISGINFIGVDSAQIIGNGRTRVSINSVTATRNTAVEGSNGDNGSSLTFKQVSIYNVSSTGGTAGNGIPGADGNNSNQNGENGGRGGDGGTGGSLVFEDCFVSSDIRSVGGQGGNGGAGGIGFFDFELGTGTDGIQGDGGNGGNGGYIIMRNCQPIPEIVSATCSTHGGSFGTGHANGYIGDNGYMYLYWCEIDTYNSISGGSARMSYFNSTFSADTTF